MKASSMTANHNFQIDNACDLKIVQSIMSIILSRREVHKGECHSPRSPRSLAVLKALR